MADWWGEVTGGGSAASKTGPSGTDWWKELSVPPAGDTSRQNVEPIRSDSSKQVGLGARFVEGFSSDPQETVRYFAKQLYPKEPVDQAVQRFGMRGDKLFHRADDGHLYEVVPQGGMSNVAGSALGSIGRAIPAMTGLTAGIATAPLATTGVGAAATMGAAYAGAAGGEYLRQKAGDVMMGDASTGDTNYLDVAKEGLMSAAGQMGGVGVGRLAERSQAGDIARFDPMATSRTYAAGKRLGVDVTPGQATGLKSVQSEEKRLATRIPETADEMQDFLGKQGRDVEDAWHNQLGAIAPSKDAETTGKAVRDAAESALADVLKVRQKAAKPFYDEWRQQRRGVETENIIKGIDKDLTTVARSSAEEKALRAAKTFLTDPEGEAVVDPLRLHSARMNLQAMIETREVDGTSINNTIAGKLKRVRGDLTDAMDRASVDKATGKSLYKQARTIFSDASDDVDDAFGSALSRIANLNDTNILNVVRETFNPKTRSPEMIARLRDTLSNKDPAAWQDLKRLWLQDSIGDALTTAQSGNVINPAGKLLSSLEAPGMRRSMNAALSSSEQSNLDEFKFLMRRISSANLSMGSDTAANRAADKAALQSATPIWAKAAQKVEGLLNPLDWGKSVERVADAASERNMRRQAGQMVKLVTSGDPDAIKAMRQLKQLTPLQWRALAASGQLALRAPPVAAGALMGNKVEQQPE